MKLALVALVALVAGCATREQRRQEAMSEPPITVCYYAVASPNQVVREESARAVYLRGIDCQPFLPIIAARMQADQAQLQQGLLLLQAGRARPISTPAQSITCRSVAIGNQVQTVCD